MIRLLSYDYSLRMKKCQPENKWSTNKKGNTLVLYDQLFVKFRIVFSLILCKLNGTSRMLI